MTLRNTPQCLNSSHPPSKEPFKNKVYISSFFWLPFSYSVSRVCAYAPFRTGEKQLKIIPELLS